MPSFSKSYAKNVIRNTLFAKISKNLTAKEKDKIWEYFEERCAYCRKKLSKGVGEAHMDHIVAGGSNHISNRALACRKCNGDEKRETEWRKFLKAICRNNKKYYQSRANRISTWRRKHKGDNIPSELLEAVNRELRKVNKTLDDSVGTIEKRKVTVYKKVGSKTKPSSKKQLLS